MALPPDATLADAGEFGLISALTGVFAQGEQVLIGPGDDAAVLRVKTGHVVVSTDLMVEGRHFRREWASAEDVGHRAAAQNLSDVNAMGGRATSLTIGLAAPADLPVQWALDFARGFAEECALVGASVVGGDVTRSDQLVIAVTVLGACTQAPVVRSGAEPGDVLAICGRQGWAAGGLAVLGRGFRSPRVLVEAYRRPEPPYDAGPGRRRGRRHRDDRRLRRAARRRRPRRRGAPASAIDVHRAAFEVPDPLQAVGAALGADPLQFILGGGDDHALLATFPEGVGPRGLVGHRLGRRAGDGPAVTVDGAAYEGPTGWSTSERRADGAPTRPSTSPGRRRPGLSSVRRADGQRVTLPALRQPVHTLRRLGVPFTVARTRWMLGSKRRFVILRDHGRLLPKPGFLAQMSQTAATVNS